MNATTIFGLQLLLSTFVFALIMRWHVSSRLNRLSPLDAIGLLLIPHAFRHIGMSFLVPSLVGEQLPAGFAMAAAYGDLASGLLAILAMFALRSRWTMAVPLVGLFSLVGVVDLANALSQAEVIPQLGVTWFIPTFVVPLLLVTHFMIAGRAIAFLRKPVPETPEGRVTAVTATS